jgi:hypothetical protein
VKPEAQAKAIAKRLVEEEGIPRHIALRIAGRRVKGIEAASPPQH